MSFADKQNVIEVEEFTPPEEFKKAFEVAERFNPAYDRILIKRELSALERRTKKSGIILTQQTKEGTKSAEGILIKCGPTADIEATQLIGKRILFSKFNGEDIVIPYGDGEKEEFILATDRDIFGELK